MGIKKAVEINILYILGIFAFLTLTACTDTDHSIQPSPVTSEPEDKQIANNNLPLNIPANRNLADQKLINFLDTHFSDLINKAHQLHQQVIVFAKSPSSSSLNETITRLDTVHESYLSSDILRTCCFSHLGAISTENSPISLYTKLDQYPLLPGYLDTVEGYPYSGLVHSDIPITKQSMLQEFQLGDPNYVTLGFHPLYVLLQGGDINRSADEFQALSSTDDTGAAAPELRRTLYAILLASEIKKDLSELKLAIVSHIQSKLAMQISDEKNDFHSELQSNIEQALESNNEYKKMLEKKDSKVDQHLTKGILDQREKLLKALLAIYKDSQATS